ncbi:NAD(P)/FAD-dependent oxidoreductase [Abyssisolibacter fermentans]|uniref:NAD(P)/FAD-dependent oxidoreductase n=1 Tax=Abyssisolibacter fermentans TaxID=1766203 RepID=UPI0008327620|nr:NAD(P)/FAD-dependent oxidoreductase [Abyssisolibacter fermentans]
MIRISQIRLNIDEDISLLKDKIVKKLRIKESDILDIKIFKESIDARRAGKIDFVYTVDIKVKNEGKIIKKYKDVSLTPDMEYKYPKQGEKELSHRPVIIGMGPAGMFAGLILAQKGYKPIILERGEKVEDRTATVNKFWETGKLNTKSNVQFGEGGAGTFSDGKLTTRIKDKRCRKVLEEFIKAGAPEDILYSHKPHVGTDILKNVVKNIRKEIINLGGEIRFNSLVSDFVIEEESIKSVIVNDDYKIDTDNVVLAIGHSARDTFEKLYERNVEIKQKPFAIGVRIEHPQEIINNAQYKQFATHKRLGAADYRLTYHASNGRSVYTFCMCPGGSVVAAASEEGMVVTNGMSEHARDKENANSALLVSVVQEDFESDHPLAGMYYQRKWEQQAFVLGGEDYKAPTQLVGDFLKGNESSEYKSVKPSYQPGTKLNTIEACLPSYVTEAMKEGIQYFDKKLKGFAMEDAILTGIETRSSSPIRILRDIDTLESINVRRLYPTGEGAGYAGGIVSAAVDGIKSAEKIIEKYKVE